MNDLSTGLTSRDTEFMACHRSNCVYSRSQTNLTPHRAMLHDPEEYPQPDEFIPERFIKGGKINPNIQDPTEIAFGFGRR